MTQEEMIAKIRKSSEIIIHNQAEESKWNDRMLDAVDYASFEEIVKSRSEAIRTYFQENEECIAVLKGCLEEPLTHEIAMEMYEAIRSMLLNGRMDPGLMYELSGPIENYLRSDETLTEQAVILTMIRVACSSDYYNRMVENMHAEELTESLRFITSQKEKYCSFERSATRINILYAYEAMIALNSGGVEREYKRRALDMILEARKLLDNPEVQALDGAEPEFALLLYNNHFMFPMELAFSAMGYPEIAGKAMDMCKQECMEYAESDNWMERSVYKLVDFGERNIRKKITNTEFMEQMFTLLKGIPDPKWSEDLNYSQTVLQVYVMIFIALMQSVRDQKITADEKEQIVETAWQDAQRVFAEIPYRYQTSYVNGLFKSLFSAMLPNVNDTAFVERLIDELLIRRQPSTYFHSYMVERIARLIAEEMLQKNPGLFTMLPGFTAEQEVKQAQEEILETICRGARLHDLGKCAVASVIMMQSRKLLEDEFACIKVHPETGAGYLEKYAEYEAILHIISGHHRSYDGTMGYPESFDNVASPYRLYIDIITISDAVDAATDILGRNYAKGKDYIHLLQELKEGAGTKYNPAIVEVMASSDRLTEELTQLTGRDRMEHCYEIYRRVVKRQK